MDKKSSIMGPIFSSVGVVALLTVLLLVVGVAIGYLLHWLLPKIEVGTGVIAGLIALCAAIFIYWKLMSSLLETPTVDELIEEQIAEREGLVIDSTRPVIHLIRDIPSSRRNKRKRD